MALSPSVSVLQSISPTSWRTTPSIQRCMQPLCGSQWVHWQNLTFRVISSAKHTFYVKFLQNVKDTAPWKFHHMMADTYEAVQHLKYAGTEHTVEQAAALDLLDLNGMDN
ncbi:hypothetical protein F4604DRAFT_1688615 [Suillus subluteus]|nr:hypothetical protein F4604DRAFT_1688615 [Suillus subluteus]